MIEQDHQRYIAIGVAEIKVCDKCNALLYRTARPSRMLFHSVGSSIYNEVVFHVTPALLNFFYARWSGQQSRKPVPLKTKALQTSKTTGSTWLSRPPTGRAKNTFATLTSQRLSSLPSPSSTTKTARVSRQPSAATSTGQTQSRRRTATRSSCVMPMSSAILSAGLSHLPRSSEVTVQFAEV